MSIPVELVIVVLLLFTYSTYYCAKQIREWGTNRERMWYGFLILPLAGTVWLFLTLILIYERFFY